EGKGAVGSVTPNFDGRLRFDLKLAYKRTEPISAEGLSGTAVVCRVTFEPLGGHVKERFAIRFLRENRDMEAWFAPIAGTGFLAPVRIYVPTLLGPAVLQVTRFVVASAPRGAEAKTQ
ncbi:MAG: DUF3108 domain-containing protein, partial [Rhizobiales bacterium]|nr:DUF3108 domain-containing protein [Hyphomicrobiales bacterium]